MAKPFDPFADDDELEFVPESEPTSIAPMPTREDATRVLSQREAEPAPPPPKKKEKPLRLDFSELADQGGDVEGAAAIGSENLAADEFLTTIKRKDYDEALQRALAAQTALPVQAEQAEPRVGRKVRTPLYLLLGGIVVFVGLLVAGGVYFKSWWEQRDAARVEALQHAKPTH